MDTQQASTAAESSGATFDYHVFISYNRDADGRLARALQVTLERFDSWWFGRGTLRVFRDRTSQESTASLKDAIKEKLESSKFFVLLACHASASSSWVQQEVDWWLTRQSDARPGVGEAGRASRLLIVWTGDRIVTRGAAGFDASQTDALPQSLMIACPSASYVDLEWARRSWLPLPWRPRFRDEAAKLVAAITGRPLDVVVNRDRRRRRLRLATAAVTIAGILSLGFLWVTSRARANHEAQAAAAQAELARTSKRASLEDSARVAARDSTLQLDAGNTLTAIETALAVLPSMDEALEPYMAQAAAALYRAVRAHAGRLTVRNGNAPMSHVEWDTDGSRLLTASADGAVVLWNVADGNQIANVGDPDLTLLDAGFRPGGARAVTTAKDGVVTVWDVEHRRPRHRIDTGDRIIQTGWLSPDGNTLLTHSDNGVRLWDLRRETLAGTLGEHEGIVVAAYSPDSEWIVTAGDHGSSSDDTDPVRLWSARDATLRRRLGVLWGASHIGFSQDGRQVAVVATEGVHVWDVTSGRRMATVAEPPTDIRWNPEDPGRPLFSRIVKIEFAAFSPDGRRLATTAENGVVHLWDVRSGRVLLKLEGHVAPVSRAAFSPDGRLLLTAGHDASARVWRVADGQAAMLFPQPDSVIGRNWKERYQPGGSYGPVGRVMAAVFSPDGRFAATAHGEGTAHVWAIEPADVAPLGRGHRGAVNALAFSADGQLLASGAADTSVRVWRVADATAVHQLQGHGDEVSAVQFSPDGRMLMSGARDKTARVWDTASGKLLRTLDSDGPVSDVAFTTNGLGAVTRDYNGKAGVIRNQFGLLRTTQEFGGTVIKIEPRDEMHFVTSTSNGTVSFWASNGGLLERVLGIELKDLGGQEHDIGDVAFSPDGAAMVTLEQEPGRVVGARLRDASANERAQLSGHIQHVQGVVFSPDSQLIATFSDDRVQVWDAPKGQLRQLLADARSTEHAAFSADGRRLVTASASGTLELWDVAVGERIDRLAGRGRISTIAFDRPGEHVAIGMSDGSLRIWRLLPAGNRMILHAQRLIGRQ